MRKWFEKEMVLVKFSSDQHIADIQVLCEAYNGGIVNAGEDMIIVMAADESKRIEYFLEASQKYAPIEIVRGGIVAIER